MTIQSFIAAKRDGQTHSQADLDWFVTELVAGRIPDYQASAWLMAAYLKGLDDAETTALTLAMAHSGTTLSHEGLPKPSIDKHSTGGVGDAVTLLFLPIMAACGLPVVKMSGRGLGFTGGTIDKLEAIPGFRTDLSPQELSEIAKRVGCALGGQTAELAPADKILYALRDATATVASFSLIAASVMSKKLAAGADVIVIDVKAGNGAFVKTPADGELLAKKLVAIGKGAGKKICALVTDMSQPLGPAVGNAFEIRAAINELKSGCRGRLGQLTLQLCDTALRLAGRPQNASDAVASGKALSKMQEWFEAQGASGSVIDDGSLLPSAPCRMTVNSTSSGFVAGFETEGIGVVARDLGAGRVAKDSVIDPSVGIEVCKEIGDTVAQGEPIFVVHAADESSAKSAAEALRGCIVITKEPVKSPPLVYSVVE